MSSRAMAGSDFEQVDTGRRACGPLTTGKAVMVCTPRRASGGFHCGIKGLWAESPATHEHCRNSGGGRSSCPPNASVRPGFWHRPTAETAYMNRSEQAHSHPQLRLSLWAGVALMAALCGPALSANWPVTPEQRSTADQVAQAGVPLSELSPTAPDSHTVVRGDTLWDVSKLFLRSPWRC